MIRASISPPRNAIIVFLVTFGDVGAFGVSASSTILSFALSFTFAIRCYFSNGVAYFF